MKTHSQQAAFEAGFTEQMQAALRLLESPKIDTIGIDAATDTRPKHQLDSPNVLFCFEHALESNANDSPSEGGWFQSIENAFRAHPPIKTRIQHLEDLKQEKPRTM